MDCRFPQMSKIGQMCDEIGGCVEFSYGRVNPTTMSRNCHILAEEFLKGSCAETASEPGAVWGKRVVQLCITREAEDQVSS